MNNLNSVLIEGTILGDPEFSTTSDGVVSGKFSIASKRHYNQDSGVAEEVSIFEIKVGSKLADAVKKYGKENRGVRVVGRLKQEQCDDSEDKSKSRIFIIAEHTEFRS